MQWCTGGFRGALNWAPMMPRDASLSDSCMSIVVVFGSTLRKLYFRFLSHWMGCDRGDSFPFDFLNQIKFHLVQNRNQSCHHDHIPFNVKGIGSIVFSVIGVKIPDGRWLNLPTVLMQGCALFPPINWTLALRGSFHCWLWARRYKKQDYLFQKLLPILFLPI